MNFQAKVLIGRNKAVGNYFYIKNFLKNPRTESILHDVLIGLVMSHETDKVWCRHDQVGFGALWTSEVGFRQNNFCSM